MEEVKHTYSPDFTDEEFEKFCKFAHSIDDAPYGLARAKALGYDIEGLSIAPGVIISNNPRMSIGKFVRLGLYTYVSGATKIGDHVLIGPHCSIAGGNHQFNAEKGWFADRSEKDKLETSIEIGEGSWLCSNVVVVAGVKVGKCNLICAGAVVTKDTEDYAIMAGVPAKKIGHIDRETGEYIYEK